MSPPCSAAGLFFCDDWKETSHAGAWGASCAGICAAIIADGDTFDSNMTAEMSRAGRVAAVGLDWGLVQFYGGQSQVARKPELGDFV